MEKTDRTCIDYDPKYGQGDGGIEFREIGSKILKLASKTIIEIKTIPYDGTEKPISTVESTVPTFDIDHDWHNRPA